MGGVSVPYYRDVEHAIGGPIDMTVATKMRDTATRTQPLTLSDFLMALRTDIPRRLAGRGTSGELTSSASGSIYSSAATKMRDTATRTQPLTLSDFLMALRTDIPRRLAGRGTSGELTSSASGSIHSSAESLDRLQEWMELFQKAYNVPLSYPDIAGDRESTEYQKPSLDFLFTSWLADTDKHEEIIVVLRLHGLDKAADRLNYLQLAAADDPDEAPIELESLRQLARFLIAEQRLPHPRIAVSPDGLMQIEWHTEDSGIIAVKFLLDGKVQFAGVAGRIGQGIESERVSGTLQKDDMMRALHPFISRLGLE